MFSPIYSCYFHYSGISTDFPKVSNTDKVFFVFTAVLAVGGLSSAAALFIGFNNYNWGFFSFGLSTFFMGVFVIKADGYRYKTLKYQEKLVKEIEESKVKEPPIRLNFAKEKVIEIEEENEINGWHEIDLNSFSIFEDEKGEIFEIKQESFTEDDLDSLKKFPSLCWQPEFSPLFPERKENTFQSEALFNHLKEFQFSTKFPEIFIQALRILSYESDLDKRRDALLFFLPYLFQLFDTQKLKLDSASVRKILMENLKIEELFSELPVVKTHLQKFIDSGIYLVEPILQFLTDDTSGKRFLFDFIYQLVFTFVPYSLHQELKQHQKKDRIPLEEVILSLKQQKDKFSKEAGEEICRVLPVIDERVKKEKYAVRRFLHLLQSFVLPQLSRMCRRRDFSEEKFECYFKGLLKLYKESSALPIQGLENFFQENRITSKTIEAKKGDLTSLVPVLTSFSKEFLARFFIIFDRLEEYVKEKEDYLNFIKEIRRIVQLSLKEISTYFEAESGIIFAKSHLLSHAIWNHLKEGERLNTAIEFALRYLIKPIQEAGINPKQLSLYSHKLTHKAMQQLKNLEGEGVDLLAALPVQDGIFFLFFTLFAVKNLDEFRPFIDRHLPALYKLLEELDIQTYKNNRLKIRAGLSLLIKLLAPLNGAILGDWWGKSGAIRLALNGLFKFAKLQFKTKEEKELLKGLKPLIRFMVLGTFGSNEREKRALKSLETTLKQFYHKLYSMELDEMVQNPQKLSEHVKESLSLLSV